MISHEKAEDALDSIINGSPKVGKAASQKFILEQYAKIKLAELYQMAPGTTVKERESYALTHESYKIAVDGTAVAIEEDTCLRFEMAGYQTIIDVYRTQQANQRKGY